MRARALHTPQSRGTCRARVSAVCVESYPPHLVDTLGVTAPPSESTGRARPKSAIFSTPDELTSTLCGFRSCGAAARSCVLRQPTLRFEVMAHANRARSRLQRVDCARTLWSEGAEWTARRPRSSWCAAVRMSDSGKGLSRAEMTCEDRRKFAQRARTEGPARKRGQRVAGFVFRRSPWRGRLGSARRAGRRAAQRPPRGGA